jgi:hypothetical protein
MLAQQSTDQRCPCNTCGADSRPDLTDRGIASPIQHEVSLPHDDNRRVVLTPTHQRHERKLAIRQTDLSGARDPQAGDAAADGCASKLRVWIFLDRNRDRRERGVLSAVGDSATT